MGAPWGVSGEFLVNSVLGVIQFEKNSVVKTQVGINNETFIKFYQKIFFFANGGQMVSHTYLPLEMGSEVRKY